jgi:hypothetical protein
MSPPASAHAVARAFISIDKTIVSYSARAVTPPDSRRRTVLTATETTFDRPSTSGRSLTY